MLHLLRVVVHGLLASNYVGIAAAAAVPDRAWSTSVAQSSSNNALATADLTSAYGVEHPLGWDNNAKRDAAPLAPELHEERAGQQSPESHLVKRIPAVVYEAGRYDLAAQGTPIVILDNGVQAAYQVGDGNFVIRVNGNPVWNSRVSLPPCTSPNWCNIAFQSDGNLVSYYNGRPTWASWTTGQGKWLVFFDVEPYLVIYNATYFPVWHTPITPPRTAPQPQQYHRGGSGLPSFSVPIVSVEF